MNGWYILRLTSFGFDPRNTLLRLLMTAFRIGSQNARFIALHDFHFLNKIFTTIKNF